MVRKIHKSAWLLAISSGVLQVLVFPKPGLYFLCWVALAPLMYAILRAREADAAQLLADDTFSYLVPATKAQGFLLGWLSGFICYLGTCYWVYHVMHLYGGLNPALAVVLLVLFALFIGLHHGVFGALLAWAGQSRAGFSRRALVLAPFLWVSVELLRTYVVSFPWDLLGTAQVNNVALARIATVTGVYGISFEIALVNAAFAAAFLVRPRRRRNLLLAAVTAAVALQATELIRIEPSPADSTAMLVQQNVPIQDNWTYQGYDKLLKDLEATSIRHEPLSSAPNVVIWPESPAPFFLNDSLFVSTVTDIAQKDQAYVIAGSIGVPPDQGPDPKRVYNSAALFDPAGALIARYDKVHLVPWGEYVPFQRIFSFAKSLTEDVGNFARGSGRAPLELGNNKYGVFICYESVFPGEIRQFADRGAQVFVNISNDEWFGNSGAPEQHLNMARMRAIENDRWLLRDTNSGITAAIDPLGRIVAQAPMHERTVLEAPYALRNSTTFYTRYGDWFPIMCAIISLIGLLWRARHGAHLAEPQPVS